MHDEVRRCETILSSSYIVGCGGKGWSIVLQAGIPCYWIVEPDEKLVEVWTPESTFPAVERECVTWRPEGVEEEFVLELEELFEPI